MRNLNKFTTSVIVRSMDEVKLLESTKRIYSTVCITAPDGELSWVVRYFNK